MVTALLLNTPLSPYLEGPPLGPAILEAHALSVDADFYAPDLNIAYLNEFESPDADHAFGDHGGERSGFARVSAHFEESLHLPALEPQRVPVGMTPVAAFPYTHAELKAAGDRMENDGYWRDFFDTHVPQSMPEPAVMGVSMMGPAQVPLSLFFARMAKKRWPHVAVVAGGSHVTLLAQRIGRDPGYGEHIDYFLPGHSEGVFAELLQTIPHGDVPQAGLFRAGEGFKPPVELLLEQRLPPVFRRDALEMYLASRLVLPLQLRRGCGFGKCAYCTYPAVEAFERSSVLLAASKFLPSLLGIEGAHHISVKDSLFDMRSMEAFGKVLRGYGRRLGWSATTKVSPAMTLERMRALQEMGCTTLELGVETIHPHTQQTIGKLQSMELVDRVIENIVTAGMVAVINLIFGMPGERREDALRQLAWFRSWKERYPDLIAGSLNMLEINYGAMFARKPELYGLVLQALGPWAASHPWNQPDWHQEFPSEMREGEVLLNRV